MERVFLGWDRPLLPSVARWMTTQVADGDFADWIVVVSGRRAGRRLLELLLEQGGIDGACLVPPRIVTASTLVDCLMQRTGAAAPALSGGATKVATERLWSGSELASSTRAPGTAAIAATISARTERSRPSLKFGTHSTMGFGIAYCLMSRAAAFVT